MVVSGGSHDGEGWYIFEMVMVGGWKRDDDGMSVGSDRKTDPASSVRRKVLGQSQVNGTDVRCRTGGDGKCVLGGGEVEMNELRRTRWRLVGEIMPEVRRTGLCRPVQES